MSERILVCDPDPQVRRALQLILRGAGHEVLVTGTGREALGWVAAERPQAVILELTLPDLDGIELCRRLRGYSELAILVLSAIDEETAKIEALGSGADDYVTKPYSPGELVARLGAQLRGSTAAGGELRFEGDGLVIDLAGYETKIGGRRIELTHQEFELLRYLAQHRGRVFTRQALLERAWGYQYAGGTRTVDIHVRRLRSKLGSAGELIETVRNVGYKIRG